MEARLQKQINYQNSIGVIMAIRRDFYEIQGDDVFFEWVVKDEDGPIDLTGSAVWITLKRKLSQPDDEAALQLVWGDIAGAIGQITDPEEGLHEFHLPSIETKNLDGKYFYDIQWRNAEGLIHTPFIGTIDFTDERTKDKE